jgi:hypothetical protein
VAVAAIGAHGEFKVEYKKTYDDPYRVLATYLVSVCTPRALSRVMNETAFIKALVLKEARQLEMSGCFLDCIDQEIISNGLLRKKNYHMKKLGEFYFSELDVPRLRREITKFADELNIIIE